VGHSSVFSPHLFRGLYEYPLFAIVTGTDLFVVSYWSFQDISTAGLAPYFCSRVAIVAILVSLIGVAIWPSATNNVRFRYRNFYGTIVLLDDATCMGSMQRRMRQHYCTAGPLTGGQLLNASFADDSSFVLYRGGPIADVLEATSLPKKVAIMSLGPGAAAAFSNHLKILLIIMKLILTMNG